MYALDTLTVDRAAARLNATACREVFQYWDRIRAGQSAPDRRDIEPFDISGALGDIVLLETEDTPATVRLAGSRLATAMAADPRARRFDTMWRNEDRHRVSEMLNYVTDWPAGVVFTCEMTTANGRTADMEGVLLPLRLDGARIRRVIGALAPLDPPYWLGSEPFESFTLINVALFPTRSDTTITPRSAPSHPIFDRALPRRRIGHLALYDGGLSQG